MSFKPCTVWGELTLISTPKACLCPGDVVVYECSVMGIPSGFTTFSGMSLINCPEMGNRATLSLKHSSFDHSQGVNGTCNNGTVFGQSISVQNDTYKSHLKITVTSALIGDTIECSYDDGRNISVIGNSTINDTGTCTRDSS